MTLPRTRFNPGIIGRGVDERERGVGKGRDGAMQFPSGTFRQPHVEDVEGIGVARVGMGEHRVEGHNSRHHVVFVEGKEYGNCHCAM